MLTPDGLVSATCSGGEATGLPFSTRSSSNTAAKVVTCWLSESKRTLAMPLPTSWNVRAGTLVELTI